MTRLALVVPPAEVGAGGCETIVRAAAGLAARGHDVTMIAGERIDPPAGTTLLRHRAPHCLMRRRAYEPGLADVPAVILRLARGRYDMAHAFAPAHAWAGAAAATLGGPPFVVSLLEPPSRTWLVSRRYRVALLRGAVDAAAAATVPSGEAATACRRYLLRAPHVVPIESERLEAVYSAALA